MLTTDKYLVAIRQYQTDKTYLYYGGFKFASRLFQKCLKVCNTVRNDVKAGLQVITHLLSHHGISVKPAADLVA